MIIRCWGARGSIPVSGREYLKYGGDTTCIEIETNAGETVIIDAGSGIRRLGNKLIERNCRNINLLFTHSHWDHLLGFPFFKPIYSKGTKMTIYGCRFAQQSIERILSNTMTPPFFPVKLENIRAELSFRGACTEPFSIHSLSISPIFLSHPNRGIGYKVVEEDKSFVFLTDNELGYQHPGGRLFADYVQFANEADLLIHDAEFTGEEYKKTKTWGHSTYDDALLLAHDANVKQFGLFHHNQERSDQAIDDIVRSCRHTTKNRNSRMVCFAVYTGMEIHL